MKIVVIGAVGSTKRLIEKLMEYNIPIEMVFSLDDKVSTNVSGYYPLHEFASQHNIPYKKYIKINDKENIELLNEIEPDYIFALGFSQLVSKEIIDSAKKGVIGLHPTALPKLRGRASIVWQILLGIKKSKVSLFFIDEGADTGDIIAQEPFEIGENDYARDVLNKTRVASNKLYDKVLNFIVNNEDLPRMKQDEKEATYALKRVPEDGRINWNLPIKEIYKLIRATSHPYPGAYSFYKNQDKFTFWKVECFENHQYIGIPGQIADVQETHIDIVCIDGILRVHDYSFENTIKLIVGNKFI